jgi:AbrB family looped-hinge helix DNA binding protein
MDLHSFAPSWIAVITWRSQALLLVLFTYVIAFLRNPAYTVIVTTFGGDSNMPSTSDLSKSHRVSVQRRNLISIPKEIRDQLNITEGDVLDVRLDNNKIVIEPFKLIPSSQAYFWSKQNQKHMVEAKKDVQSGNIREFSNINEFLEGLDND